MGDLPQQHARPRPLPLFLALLQRETAGDPARAAAALAGLQAFQAGEREVPPLKPAVAASVGRARLLDYGGVGRPVVVVPSLINDARILDLAEGRSLLRWLATQELHPLLVDWGSPNGGERALSIAGHIETMLLPMLRSMDDDVALVGYCLGGTMALAAAAVRRPAALALIATPWRFAAFPRAAGEGLAALWREAAPIVDELGLLPLELLQAGFWQLDPGRTIDKFAAFAAMTDPAARRLFVAMEDWANDGPPLTAAAGDELIHDLFGRDVTGHGAWRVAGCRVDPDALGCPVLDVASTVDRIVPAASAAGIGRALALDLGHVGMVAGGRARAALWEPLAAWLRDRR